MSETQVITKDGIKIDYQSEPIRAAIDLLIEEKNMWKKIAKRQSKLIENLERLLPLKGWLPGGN